MKECQNYNIPARQLAIIPTFRLIRIGSIYPQLLSADYTQLPNGKYELNLTVEVEKLKADKIGMEQAVDLDDYIYIGAYAKDDSELYHELHRFNEKENRITLILDEVPFEAGVDPTGLLIERVRDDNVVEVTRK